MESNEVLINHLLSSNLDSDKQQTTTINKQQHQQQEKQSSIEESISSPTSTSTSSLPFSHNRSNSSLISSSTSNNNNNNNTSTTIKLISLTSLILFTTLSSSTLPIASLQNRLALLSIPPIQFLILGIIILLLGKLGSTITTGGGKNNKFGVTRILNYNQNHLEEDDEKRKIKLVASLSVLTSLLTLWQSRWMDDKLWAALEVFIIPMLFLLPPILQHFYHLPNLSPSVSESHYLTIISVTFLIGFSLVGIPAAAGGAIFLALLRIPVEGTRWIFLKHISGLDKPGSFLLSCCAWAFIFSSSILALSTILLKDHQVLPKPELHNLLLHSLYSLFSQLSLLTTIHLFSSPLIAGFALFPRNLILLILSRRNEGGGGASKMTSGFGLGESNWQQMVFVLGAGTIATILTDGEIISLGPNWREGKLGRFVESLPRVIRPIPTISNSNVNGNHSNSNSSSNSQQQQQSHHHTTSLSLSLVPFLPLFLFLLQSPSTSPSLSVACSYLPSNLKSVLCYSPTPSLPTDSTVDLVFAYYDENLDSFKNHLDNIRGGDFVRVRENRVVVYNKGYKTEREIRERVGLREGDMVVGLENYGREGATYLRHILLNYNASLPTLLLSSSSSDTKLLKPKPKSQKNKKEQLEVQTELADHTYFLQPHLAWSNIAEPRIKTVDLDTGFLSFGPYMVNYCSTDGRGVGEYILVKSFYEMFTHKLCPPQGVLSGWSAQFVVSKKRILANPYDLYQSVSEMIEAPTDHWIHHMWGPNGAKSQSNPAAGHSLERSWPLIFGCSDPKIANECLDEVSEKGKCQCLDQLDWKGDRILLK